MNYRIFHLVNSAAGRWPPVDHVMRFAAVYLVFLVFSIGGAVVVHALLQRRFRAVISLGATLLLALALTWILAATSPERRPFQDHPVHQLIAGSGVSTPSDQAAAAFAVAFAVLVFLNRPMGYALTAVAALIGVAGVWTGVHYPGDVVAGAVIAALSAFSAYVIGRGPREFEAGWPPTPNRVDRI